jgi:hypothetical protein
MHIHVHLAYLSESTEIDRAGHGAAVYAAARTTSLQFFSVFPGSTCSALIGAPALGLLPIMHGTLLRVMLASGLPCSLEWLHFRRRSCVRNSATIRDQRRLPGRYDSARYTDLLESLPQASPRRSCATWFHSLHLASNETAVKTPSRGGPH